jgi:hypothetical protein
VVCFIFFLKSKVLFYLYNYQDFTSLAQSKPKLAPLLVTRLHATSSAIPTVESITRHDVIVPYSADLWGSGVPKDGNGDPIPDSPRGIPLLGDEDGTSFSPTENYMEGNPSPSGLTGAGMVVCPRPRSPLPCSDLLHTGEAQDV